MIKWREQDLLDFELIYRGKIKEWNHPEYVREEDDDVIWAAQLLAKKPDLAEATRSEWFYLWMDRHRKMDFKGVSPGQETYSLLFWTKILFVALGCFAAWLLMCGSFQLHDQAESLNILAFIGVGVLLPFALSMISFYILWSQAAQDKKGFHLPALPAFLRGSFALWMRPFWSQLTRWFSGKVDAEYRMDFSAIMSEIRLTNLQYGKLFNLRLASVLQCFGLAYVCALLLQIAWQFLGSLKVFIWSTSFMESITPMRLHGAVELLSLSMSSLSESQIALSQYVGAQMSAADPSATEAWACFLILVLILWAVLPRVVLLICYACSISSRVRYIDFHELYYEKLHILLTSHVGWYHDESAVHAKFEPLQDSLPSGLPHAVQGEIVCFTLQSYENSLLLDRILKQLHEEDKPLWDKLITVQSILDDPQQSWKKECATLSCDSLGRIYVLQAAYEPATKQRLKFLQTLRECAGTDLGIDVLLFALPAQQITPAQLEDWQRGVLSLLDRNLVLSKLPVLI